MAVERIPGPLASLYEKGARMVIDSYYSEVADEIVAHLQSGTILDLGTGPGYLPIEIVKRAPAIRIDGIDLTLKLIKMARENSERAQVADRLHFEVGNAANLRFDDNSYDMVISTGMLHSLKDPVGVINECYRVLKPGGEAWIFDPARVSSAIDVRKWIASLTLWEKLLGILFALGQRFNPAHTYNQQQAIEIVSATDFADYSIEEGNGEIKIKLRK
ncbi:MAG: class I SAM-dependent methyltransferase [Chloroflexota bacterium]|nr:class I SAM-dependent methyltransferase [Chloroflexota bacterium]